MPKRLKLHVLPFLLTFNLLLSSLSAQTIMGELDFVDSTQTHIITTQRGDVFFGRILSLVNAKISFEFKETILVFNLHQLKKIEVIESEEKMKQYAKQPERQNNLEKRYAYPNMHGHEHLLIGPTAFNLKKKQGEYRNTGALMNMVDYGISDNFSIGGGLIIPFLIHFRAKYTQPILPNIRVGGGTDLMIIIIDTEANGEIYNHSYAVISIGTPDRFITGAAGYFFPFSDEFTDKTTVFTVGGGFRMSKNWRFMLQNLILPGLLPKQPRFFPTMNVGWFNQKNRIDFGLMTFQAQFSTFDGSNRHAFFPIPTFSYARRLWQ